MHTCAFCSNMRTPRKSECTGVDVVTVPFAPLRFSVRPIQSAVGVFRRTLKNTTLQPWNECERLPVSVEFAQFSYYLATGNNDIPPPRKVSAQPTHPNAPRLVHTRNSSRAKSDAVKLQVERAGLNIACYNTCALSVFVTWYEHNF
jgi:hypothetical protein